MTADALNWGASWRQRDFDPMMSQEVRQAFRAVGAVPVTWGQVGTLLTFQHSTRPPSQWLSAETVSG